MRPYASLSFIARPCLFCFREVLAQDNNLIKTLKVSMRQPNREPCSRSSEWKKNTKAQGKQRAQDRKEEERDEEHERHGQR